MKSILVLGSLVLAACLMLSAQQPSMNTQGQSPATPPTFPSDQTRPATPDNMPPDTKAPPAQPGDSSRTSQSSGSIAAGETTMEGCLSGSEGAYSLQRDSGSVTLQGDSAELRKHVGQQVRVSGTQGESSASASTGTSGDRSMANSRTDGDNTDAGLGTTGTGSNGESAFNSLNVTSIKKVADSCAAPPSPSK